MLVASDLNILTNDAVLSNFYHTNAHCKCTGTTFPIQLNYTPQNLGSVLLYHQDAKKKIRYQYLTIYKMITSIAFGFKLRQM